MHWRTGLLVALAGGVIGAILVGVMFLLIVDDWSSTSDNDVAVLGELATARVFVSSGAATPQGGTAANGPAPTSEPTSPSMPTPTPSPTSAPIPPTPTPMSTPSPTPPTPTPVLPTPSPVPTPPQSQAAIRAERDYVRYMYDLLIGTKGSISRVNSLMARAQQQPGLLFDISWTNDLDIELAQWSTDGAGVARAYVPQTWEARHREVVDMFGLLISGAYDLREGIVSLDGKKAQSSGEKIKSADQMIDPLIRTYFQRYNELI